MNTHIKFGRGVRFSLEEIIRNHQWEHVGIVVDHNIVELPAVKEIYKLLQKVTKRLFVGTCRISEPTYDSLEEVRPNFADDSIQMMIGVGGGSAIDMAKAMAVLVKNKKPALEYRGFDKMTEPVLPIVAVPTTAGTGSEVTPNASFIDSHAKKKLGINGNAIRPRYGLLDPELTLSCPKAATISAAMDSVVHAVEAYVAQKTNPIARFFAQEGLKRVFEALPALTKDLGNLELRQTVMYGAFLSGIALMHSGTGPAAALSYPLGVHYGVPHGLGGAFFLPRVIKHNLVLGYQGYGDLYDVIVQNHGVKDAGEKARKFYEKIVELWNQVEIPQELTAFGFNGTPEETASFVKETLELKGALDQNPVLFGAAEIQAALS
ncbi:MAG: iron-containing alcohol dehydrogenase [Thermodesulfobacteriota bacterium]